MDSSLKFSCRLATVREADEKLGLRGEYEYRNGQILANSEDVSQWDNFDRYYKFGSIIVN
jgi:hypothetical protein